MSRRGLKKGFSLVEVLIVVAISAIIGVTLISILMGQIQLTTTQNRNIINQESMRTTLDFMIEEIRAMGSGMVEPYINIAVEEELEYVGDMDGDSNPDRVNYLIEEDGTLRRRVWTSTDGGATWTSLGDDDLLTNVSSFSFTYFAFDNEEPADIDEITSVEMIVSLDVGQDQTAFTDGKVADQSLLGRVTIRNRLME